MVALTNLEIEAAHEKRPIQEVAQELNLDPSVILPHGHHIAKIPVSELEKRAGDDDGALILVTAMTPTPAGEGKTTTSIGLGDALRKAGRLTALCLREPSLGPYFGIKGGGTGTGYAQIVPAEDINLHFVGDMYSVSKANNLLAALIDNHLQHGNELGIDPRRVTWRRVIDLNDRALREIFIGLGGVTHGIPRKDGFNITPASEVMAVLCLARDYRDLRDRLARIVIGYTYARQPVTADMLLAEGAMTVLLRDAIHPNLVQTLEGTPAFVHAGPFANIAHGNSSILADQVALKLGDYIVTESGFGADIGMEKFMNIKCRYSGLVPDAVVLVATIRALKMHGGGPRVIPGKPLNQAYKEENLELLGAGLDNLRVHIRNAKRFGVPVVVAVNKFTEDTLAEVELIRKASIEAGAETAVMSDHWTNGGDGSVDLAKAVVAACEQPSDFKFLYPLDLSIKEKITIIAKEIYQAGDVVFEPLAERQIKFYESNGFGDLPICMAKTHLSISHDPSLKNAPSGYTLSVREARASVGAGFIYPLLGAMRTMPGLGSKPAYMNVDVDEEGRVIGLF